MSTSNLPDRGPFCLRAGSKAPAPGGASRCRVVKRNTCHLTLNWKYLNSYGNSAPIALCRFCRTKRLISRQMMYSDERSSTG